MQDSPCGVVLRNALAASYLLRSTEEKRKLMLWNEDASLIHSRMRQMIGVF